MRLLLNSLIVIMLAACLAVAYYFGIYLPRSTDRQFQMERKVKLRSCLEGAEKKLDRQKESCDGMTDLTRSGIGPSKAFMNCITQQFMYSDLDQLKCYDDFGAPSDDLQKKAIMESYKSLEKMLLK